MKLNIYSIFDIKAGVFSRPFPSATNLTAIREFSSNCQNPKTMLYTHPEDYRLFLLGEFDEHTGKYYNLDMPQLLSDAVEHKPKQPDQLADAGRE